MCERPGRVHRAARVFGAARTLLSSNSLHGPLARLARLLLKYLIATEKRMLRKTAAGVLQIHGHVSVISEVR